MKALRFVSAARLSSFLKQALAIAKRTVVSQNLLELFFEKGKRPRERRGLRALWTTCGRRVAQVRRDTSGDAKRIGRKTPARYPVRALNLWGGKWDSNPRQPESQSGTLPTELFPPQNFESCGLPGRIRTSDHLLRRQMLYPTELRAGRILSG